MKISSFKKKEVINHLYAITKLHKQYYPKYHLTKNFSYKHLANYYKIIIFCSTYNFLAFDQEKKLIGFLISGKFPKYIFYKLFLSSPIEFTIFLLSIPKYS